MSAPATPEPPDPASGAGEVRPDDAERARLDRLLAETPQLAELGRRFAEAGHELHLVGGAVRDALLARDVEIDLDLATDARPETTEAILRDWARAVWLTGASFGTVSALHGEDTVEVTTYRSDVYTPGSRHPEVTYGDTIDQDLTRRDFTVNALALRLSDGALVDTRGGLPDLRVGVLRTPVTPEQSFRDDPLRMVRLARFGAVLGFSVEPATLAAATALASELGTISAERIRVELHKLLLGARPDVGFALLADAGLLGHVPGLGTPLGDADRRNRVRARLERLRVLRERGLGHVGGRLTQAVHRVLVDAPKPASNPSDGDRPEEASGPEQDEAVRALAHAGEVLGWTALTADLDDVGPALRTLTCSGAVQNDTAAVVADLPALAPRHNWAAADVRRLVARHGDRLPTLLAASLLEVGRDLDEAADGLEAFADRHGTLAAAGELEDLGAPIDGRAIMDRLGIPPGPVVGEAVAHLVERRLATGRMSVEEAHAALDAWWADRDSASA